MSTREYLVRLHRNPGETDRIEAVIAGDPHTAAKLAEQGVAGGWEATGVYVKSDVFDYPAERVEAGSVAPQPVAAPPRGPQLYYEDGEVQLRLDSVDLGELIDLSERHLAIIRALLTVAERVTSIEYGRRAQTQAEAGLPYPPIARDYPRSAF
jgi:hypothetical protein